MVMAIRISHRGLRNVHGLETGQWKIGVRVERPIAALTQRQAVPARAGDHGGVVGVQAWARDGDACQPRKTLRRELRERTVARHPAAQDGGAMAGGSDRPLQFRHEHVEHRVLEGAGEMRPVAFHVVARPHGAQHRGLQAGE